MTWRTLAECQYVDPELFFPEQGEQPRAARMICNGCEVQTKCLEAALNLPGDQDRYGVFGGTTATERNRLRLLRRNTISA
jgi:WhiB family redox-sensing transcriptional regulator